MEDCPHALEPSQRTNGSLAEWLKAEQAALDECNTDKAALRAWAGQK